MGERELVTILCEPTLEEKVLDVLRRAGASGFSTMRSEGDSTRAWSLEVMEGANVRIETVVSEETAAKIVQEISKRFFAHRSLVVWQTTVRVQRPERFH